MPATQYGIPVQNYSGKEEELIREPTIFQNLLNQFEKYNSEQQHNTDRLLTLQNKLNLEPPVPMSPEVQPKMLPLTNGDGLLSALEGMVNKYHEYIVTQYSVLSRLEKYI